MGRVSKSVVDKELERAKRDKFPGTVKLERNGQEVAVELYRPSAFHPTYYATWVDPVTDQRIVGQATVEEVHAALERRIRLT